MAKKPSVQYVCSNCGATSSSWSGRCYNCGEWNTLQEQTLLGSNDATKGKKTIMLKQLDRLKTRFTKNDIWHERS